MAGIDYGMGQTNIDKETGIRFGVINQNEVTQAWCDSSEADYGEPTCPKCGNEVSPFNPDSKRQQKYKAGREYSCCQDFACKNCKVYLDSDMVYGEEPFGFSYHADGYTASSGNDGYIFIIKSPYYTKADFCSPCAPGACYLTSPNDDAEKAYCFGHDWFNDNQAPYPVYDVKTGKLVLPS